MSESEICPVHNQHHLPYESGDQCWDGKHPNSTLGEPKTQHEHDEDGNAYNPSVIWELSIGCTASIGYQDGQLVALVNTSDEDKRDGITKRAVTREQVTHYGHQLLALVDEEYRTALQGLYGIASKLGVDPKWSDDAQDLIGRIAMLGIEPLQKRAIAAEDQLGDIRHALASEGFCAPDTDEWTSLSNVRARIQDLVDRAKKAEQEHAGLERMAVQARDDNAYHVARYQRMIADAVGWDPEAAYPGHTAAEEALAGLRERADKAWRDGADAAYAAVYADIAETYGLASSPEGRPVDRVNAAVQAIAERVKTAEAELYTQAQALAGLQLAVLALPVGAGGAACDDDYVRIAGDAKRRIEELTAERDAELGEAYRRGWRAGEVEKEAEEREIQELRERAERAGNPDIRDLAYRTMRQQRDEAIARANDAAAERDQLVGFACDGSATCPSPLHVDGCFRSATESEAGAVDLDSLAIPDLTEGEARSFDVALAEMRPSVEECRCSESECRRGECCHHGGDDA